MVGKAIRWIRESNRWKHLFGGAAIGALCDGWYCAALAGGVAGGAMEFKDRQWGGKPDWVDFALTLAGAVVGYGIRYGLCNMVCEICR